MTHTQIKRFQVTLSSRHDAQWLKETLNREGRKFGTKVILDRNDNIVLTDH